MLDLKSLLSAIINESKGRFIMKNKLIKRIISLVLTLIVVATLIPIYVDASLAKPKITDLSHNEAGGVGVMFNSVKGASSYEILYSTDKNFSKKQKVTTTSTYYTQITSVAKGTYYFKIRACAVKNGKKINSAFSAVKKVKVTNGAISISLGKEKSGTLTKGKSSVAYTINRKTATYVKFKISTYANDKNNPESEWSFSNKQGDYTDFTVMNTDEIVKSNTKYNAPYYTFTSPEAYYLPAGKHSFNLNVLEYMFDGVSNYKLNYKITIIETDRPF